MAALAFVNRSDTVLLFAIPVAEMTLRSLFVHGAEDVRAVARRRVAGDRSGSLFATFYYGFPLPNTYYAKVANGIPAWLQHQQGWAYLFNSISHDPITLGTIALAALFAWSHAGRRRGARRSARCCT